MKEYDENEAIAAMMDVLPLNRRDEDAVFEILDLIYDYYESNGDLDISIDDESDDEVDMEAMLTSIRKQLRRHPAAVDFSDSEIEAMVKAEIEYQDTLL